MAADDGAGAAAPAGGSHTIHLRPVGEAVVCGPEETVLSAILRSGASVVFGCRGGGCGICKMRLLSGAVEHGRCSAAVLPEDERRSGALLSCQARPTCDVTVELTPANRYRRSRVHALWNGVAATAPPA
jgi:ferredoxin